MKNKAVDIYFFTGTGNTYLAARKISEILQKNGCIVVIKNIAKTDPTKINLSNTIGICFPVACCNTFPIVKNFITGMPKSDGTELFVISTMGSFSFNIVAGFGNILRNKGYSLIGTQGFLMPNNFTNVQKEEKNIIKREKAYKKIEDFAKCLIMEGGIKVRRINLFLKISFIISNFITDRWKGALFQKLVKFHAIKDKCIKCGLCIDICPVKNISFDNGYPLFDGKKCQLCMKCISYCPSKAIKSFFINKTYRALTIEEVKE